MGDESKIARYETGVHTQTYTHTHKQTHKTNRDRGFWAAISILTSRISLRHLSLSILTV
jgi:hypothetical protein